MSKIYTTYLSKLNKIPEGSLKLFIARDVNDRIKESLEKYNCIHLPESAPSRELRDKFKGGEIDFNKFQVEYAKEQAELDGNDIIRVLEIMVPFIIANYKYDIYMICYEKDAKQCHRATCAEAMSEILTGITKHEVQYAGEAEI